jgi:hypothetical protein
MARRLISSGSQFERDIGYSPGNHASGSHDDCGRSVRSPHADRDPSDRANAHRDTSLGVLRHPGYQVVHPRQKQLENGRGVGFVISHYEVNRRAFALDWPGSHGPG